MPNTKQASKRNRQRDKRHLSNRLVLGTMRSAIKRAKTALDNGSDEAQALVQRAVSSIDKAVSKGAVHRRTASRYISRLVRKAS